MTDDLLPLSEIAFAPPFPNPAPTDAVGELAWVSVSDLYIDPKYQRPINDRGEKNIRQVIENFSWALFSPVVVARRPGGRFAVIDGQHRAIAALTHGGIEKVPALIINGSPSDEAKAFAVINGAVTAILPTQIWAARVVAGDYDAILLSRLLDKVGVRVLKTPKAAKNYLRGETVAIDAIEATFKRYGHAATELALRTVVDTGDGNPSMLKSPLIKATAAVLWDSAKWQKNSAGVLSAISTVGVRNLWARAEKAKHDNHTSYVAAYSEELTKLFTKELGPK